MNLIAIIQALEETVYEIALWTLLLPKTLFQVIFKPAWIRGYVTSEWEKEPVERFKDFMSPVLFWILVSIIPTAILTTRHANASASINAPTFIPSNESIIYATCALLITPVFFAYWLLAAQHQPVERDSLKRHFYIQCLALAIIQLFEIPMRFTVFAGIAGQSLAPRFVLTSIMLYTISIVWLVLIEAQIFKQELQVDWRNAMVRVVMAVIVRQAIIALAAIAVFVVLTGLISFVPG